MHMSLKVLRRSPIVYVMSVGARDVGWFSTGRIGLAGFADHADAQRAGGIAAALLTDWYRARWNHPPEAWADAVTPEHALMSDGVTIGRIVAHHLLSEPGESSWAIELRLPDDTWVAVMLELAQRMYVAVAEVPTAAA